MKYPNGELIELLDVDCKVFFKPGIILGNTLIIENVQYVYIDDKEKTISFKVYFCNNATKMYLSDIVEIRYFKASRWKKGTKLWPLN